MHTAGWRTEAAKPPCRGCGRTRGRGTLVCVRDLFRRRCERGDVDVVLVKGGELRLESFDFLEESISRDALCDEFVAKLEPTSRGRLVRVSSLGHHRREEETCTRCLAPLPLARSRCLASAARYRPQINCPHIRYWECTSRHRSSPLFVSWRT